MHKLFKHVILAGAAAFAMPAQAAVITLDFENIAATYPFANDIFIQGFYNGGTASNGRSGTNFGIEFSSNSLAVCLNSTTTSCSNGSRGGGAPGSETGALFFLSGSESFMNVAAGFDTGFSFNYSAINQAGSVSVYDGLNGTGNLLATLALPTTSGSCPGYGASFCPFAAIGVAFAGTARSVSFAGVANQIAFDDITFGSVTPGAVPEPAAWAMMIGGFGLIGGVMRRSRVKVSFA
jgi:hypothetical protein